MTDAVDKDGKYYQGPNGVKVFWMKPYQERPPQSMPDKEPLKTRIGQVIRLGMTAIVEVWRAGFQDKKQ